MGDFFDPRNNALAQLQAQALQGMSNVNQATPQPVHTVGLVEKLLSDLQSTLHDVEQRIAQHADQLFGSRSPAPPASMQAGVSTDPVSQANGLVHMLTIRSHLLHDLAQRIHSELNRFNERL